MKLRALQCFHKTGCGRPDPRLQIIHEQTHAQSNKSTFPLYLKALRLKREEKL